MAQEKIRITGNFKLQTEGGFAEYSIDSDTDPDQKGDPSIDWVEKQLTQVVGMFREGLRR